MKFDSIEKLREIFLENHRPFLKHTTEGEGRSGIVLLWMKCDTRWIKDRGERKKTPGHSKVSGG